MFESAAEFLREPPESIRSSLFHCCFRAQYPARRKISRFYTKQITYRQFKSRFDGEYAYKKYEIQLKSSLSLIPNVSRSRVFTRFSQQGYLPSIAYSKGPIDSKVNSTANAHLKKDCEAVSCMEIDTHEIQSVADCMDVDSAPSTSKRQKLDEFNSRPTNEKALKYGFPVLHAWIRFMEFVLHVSYRLKLKEKSWQIPKKDKEIFENVKNTKSAIQKGLRESLGVIVDQSKPGSGNTNNGNLSKYKYGLI
ncbi:unnamed protein product [Trichogramma brassicae]|uniref:Uncharacterized protein n=1 Tax=Trichogramma brassicae TaxID=86971 RepID=A0A6H5J772_9HYME|nr:unnamed protein product [Trichogramma brassicae]